MRQQTTQFGNNSPRNSSSELTSARGDIHTAGVKEQPRSRRLLGSIGQLNDEGKLTLGTTGGCLVLGACGWMANYLSPGSNGFNAFLTVAAIYLLLSVGTVVRSRIGSKSSGEPAAPRPARRGETSQSCVPSSPRLRSCTSVASPSPFSR